MAKTLPAAFGEIDPSEHARGGQEIVFDGGERGWRGLVRDQHWLLANRVTTHVSAQWPGGAFSRGGGGFATNRSVRETAVAYVDRLQYRLTPRLHILRYRVWCNADTDGGTGRVRVNVGANNLTFTFAATYAGGNEQTGTIAVTGGTPPATDLVTVRMEVGTSAFIDLRWLTIADDPLVLADMP